MGNRSAAVLSGLWSAPGQPPPSLFHKSPASHHSQPQHLLVPGPVLVGAALLPFSSLTHEKNNRVFVGVLFFLLSFLPGSQLIWLWVVEDTQELAQPEKCQKIPVTWMGWILFIFGTELSGARLS